MFFEYFAVAKASEEVDVDSWLREEHHGWTR